MRKHDGIHRQKVRINGLMAFNVYFGNLLTVNSSWKSSGFSEIQGQKVELYVVWARTLKLHIGWASLRLLAQTIYIVWAF